MTKNERLTLAISTLALFVSGFSFIDNHVQVMPALVVSNPGTSLPTTGDPHVPIWITIMNKGKLDATITEIDAVALSSRLQKDQDDCNKALRDTGKTQMDNFGRLGEIPGGGMTLINPYITLPKSCSEIPEQIVVDLAIRYHDFLHIPYTSHAAIRAIREKTVAAPPKLDK